MKFFWALCIAMVVLGASGPRYGDPVKDRSTITFLTAHDFVKLAGQTSATTLPDEDANTLPVPQVVGDEIVILVMYFHVHGRLPQRRVSPPHYALQMEPTGKVLRFWPVTPAELGIHDSNAVVPDVTRLAGMSPYVFVEKRKRFLDLSSSVWSAFANGRSARDESVRSEVQEYWQLFSQITSPEVAPFYLQACREFFTWVRSAR